MKDKANTWIRALLATITVCAALGLFFGLAKIAERHGPKLVDFVAARLPQIEWGVKLIWMALEQALGLVAIAIFWAFLLSPIFFLIGRYNQARD